MPNEYFLEKIATSRWGAVIRALIVIAIIGVLIGYLVPPPINFIGLLAGSIAVPALLMTAGLATLFTRNSELPTWASPNAKLMNSLHCWTVRVTGVVLFVSVPVISYTALQGGIFSLATQFGIASIILCVLGLCAGVFAGMTNYEIEEQTH